MEIDPKREYIVEPAENPFAVPDPKPERKEREREVEVEPERELIPA